MVVVFNSADIYVDWWPHVCKFIVSPSDIPRTGFTFEVLLWDTPPEGFDFIRKPVVVIIDHVFGILEEVRPKRAKELSPFPPPPAAMMDLGNQDSILGKRGPLKTFSNFSRFDQF